MDRQKIERIWQAAHKLAELTAVPPGRGMTSVDWGRYEAAVAMQILQLNMIVMAP